MQISSLRVVDNRPRASIIEPLLRPPDYSMKVSVVAPCYNEANGLAAFFARITAICEQFESYEIVVVDDGSEDATWSVIKDFSRQNNRVVGIRLSRNHGHQLALSAGLASVSGDRILIIDADLQDPPELLPEMMRLMDGGADVVYGQRRSRQGVAVWKRVAYKAFYKLLSALAGCNIPPDTGDFRLISRTVADYVNRMPEHHRFLRGMIPWLGFTQLPLMYDRHPRHAGSSQYTLKKLFRLALDGITSFSIKPLRIASLFSFLLCAGAILGLLFVFLRWWAERPVQGWTSLVITVLFLGSMQLLVLGIIGEYLGRLFIESKARPLFIVREVIRSAPQQMEDNPASALLADVHRG